MFIITSTRKKDRSKNSVNYTNSFNTKNNVANFYLLL